MFDSWKIDSQGVAGLSRGRYVLAVCGTLALAALAAMAVVRAPTAQAQGGPPPITDPGAPSGDNIQPDLVQGNPTCADLGYGTFERKVEPVTAGTYTLGGFSVTISNVGERLPDPPEGPEFDFAANMGVDAVIVKGGDAADSYVYNTEDNADTKLHAPVNPSNGKYFGLSHVSFCIDFELGVTKDAEPKFTRTYTWDIQKSNRSGSTAANPIVLAPGQDPHEVTYDVTVTNTGFLDSDFAVEGTITVKNFAPVAAGGVDVKDEIEGIGEVEVDCSEPYFDENDPDDGLPASVPAWTNGVPGELTCKYRSDLPDADSRMNTATATTTTAGIGSGTGTAQIVFGDPTTEKDTCVDVTDTLGGDLGEVCLDDLDEGGPPPDRTTITYVISFDPDELECGTQTVTNEANFVTRDTGTSQQEPATSDVYFDVRCGEGCTLTPGYWKTHSREGPAPYDDNWANLSSSQEDTDFFYSGKTYYQVLWTSPQGNAYYILAHAYIAAELNILNDATVPAAVQTAFDAATALFNNTTNTPAYVAGAKGPSGNALRSQFISLAKTLDGYNNGLTGPGHCTDQNGA